MLMGNEVGTKDLKMQFLRTKLTSWSEVCPDELTVAQLVKKFLVFYGSRSFITVFTRAHPYPEPNEWNSHL
jgi:hypothetical protein